MVRNTNGLRIELSVHFQQKCCENNSKFSHVLGDVQGVTSLAAGRYCRLYKLICNSLMAAFLPTKIGVLPEAIHVNLQCYICQSSRQPKSPCQRNVLSSLSFFTCLQLFKQSRADKEYYTKYAYQRSSRELWEGKESLGLGCPQHQLVLPQPQVVPA